MPVNLDPGRHHTWSGPQGDYITVTNESGKGGRFKLSYKSGSSQKLKIGGYATKNKTPKSFPVTVTNIGNTKLSVGVA